MSNPLEQFRNLERIRLIESDLALTNDFIKGVVATGTAVRGIAVTVWLAIVGVALQQQMTSLAVVAAFVSLAFWLIDGYYGWLYGEASVHARKCESLLSAYYNAISRAADDSRVIDRLHASLRGHRFGLYTGFRSGYGISQWWHARPKLLYRALYLSILAVTVGIATLIGTGVITNDEAPAPREHIVHLQNDRR